MSSVLTCRTCAVTVDTDNAPVVAAAETEAFLDAHVRHDVGLSLREPPDDEGWAVERWLL